MENILQRQVTIYLNEMLIKGKTDKEQLENLEMVLRHFSKVGLWLRREKYMFQAAQVTCLGYTANKTGLHLLEDKWPDGEEHPVVYHFQTLADAERKYAQAEKEGLMVIYGPDQITVEDGILSWGAKVIVLSKDRCQIQAELHPGNPGVSKLKMLERCYVWWPGLNADIAVL
eukprot:g35134.t1